MDGKECLRIAREMESCKGMEIYRQIANLMRSYEILRLNFNDLEKLLAWFSVPSNAITIMDRNHPEKMSDFWLHASRHLHNYLASVNTLIDHMRRFKNKETRKSFTDQYDARLAKIKESPLSTLIPDLRSYFLHYDIPPIGSSFSVSRNEDPITCITLDCEELLRWDGWKGASREYLSKAGPSLSILQILREYQSLLVAFFNWFHTEILRTYKTELDELTQLDRQLKRYAPKP